MATVRLYLDRRACAEGAAAPVKITVNMRGGTAMQATGVRVQPGQWDARAGRVVRHPQRQALNALLAARLGEWETALLRLTVTGEAARARSAAELKRMIEKELLPEEEKRRAESFYEHFRQYAEHRRTPGTRDAYRQTLRRMEAFDGGLRGRTFEEIDRRWLTRFEEFMERTAPSANSRAFHFRNIRAVLNDAVDEGLTAAYPFRKFRIRREPTAKRALTLEQLRTLARCPCGERTGVFRDLFMLMFYLIGINATDLFRARPGAVQDGRLEYVRSKTGKAYSIKIEPEAAELLERYRGRAHLLSAMDTRTCYKSYLHRMDDALKLISAEGDGGVPLCPRLSQYWSRHSWATVAASLDIPKETIAAGLGHGGWTVTDIYIDFDRRKVDEANRRVIDWVLYGKR